VVVVTRPARASEFHLLSGLERSADEIFVTGGIETVLEPAGADDYRPAAACW